MHYQLIPTLDQPKSASSSVEQSILNHVFNKNHITEESTHKCYFKAGDAEISKNKEYSNLLHTYCDADHERDISDRHSVTSSFHLFNSTIIDWCAKKQSETSRSRSNSETRAMYTGVLDQNSIRFL